jgi:DNA-binding MurR/RpiR family transcriptional regulator
MPAHASPSSLHARVRLAYGQMPPAERRLGDLILNFPGELAGYSGSELAKMAETSSAAVSRFVRRLGFSSYEEMRRQAREEKGAGSPLYLIDHNFGASRDASPAESIDRYVGRFIDNLRSTFSALDHEALNHLADSVAKARRVFVVGFRHSFYLAGHLCWSLAHARADVHLLPRGGETLGESLVDVGPGDVMLLIALRRRVAAIQKIIAAVRANETKVAIVCDPGMVDTAGAEWVIRCQSSSRGVIDDHCSALAISHALTELVLARDPARTRERLAEIDEIHKEFEELG